MSAEAETGIEYEAAVTIAETPTLLAVCIWRMGRTGNHFEPEM